MGLVKSFKFALLGLVYIWKTERNARIHLFMATLALLLGILLGVSNQGLAAIFFAIIMVFLAEIFNSAFELTLDLIDRGHNPKIKLIKDMAAGAVLVASTSAVAIGLMVFWPYVWKLFWPGQ